MNSPYRQNKTMELLGHQSAVFAGTDADRGIRDIITAYAGCSKHFLEQEILKLFSKGFLFGMLADIYNLGVIAGKREERKRG